MSYLIGLDIGTSSVKGVLMTESGEITEKAHESFEYSYPGENMVEITGDKFLGACFKAIKKLADGAEGKEIRGICASSASGNLVVLDKDNKPLTPIINWQDKRVTTESKEILGDMDLDRVYERIGWPFGGAAFPLAQLCYIKKHSPEILESCGMVCMSTEYLYFALTGMWGISGSAGTPFYLIDQVKGEYIPELTEAFGINESQLPPVIPCGSVVGVVTDEASAISGIPSGIPVVSGSFDHPSAARGVGVLNEGEMLLSCGTSWVGFFPVKDRDRIVKAKTLIDPFLSPDGCWATMVSVPSVSARIKLYVNKYIDSTPKAFDILSGLALKSTPGAGGLVINPQDDPDDEKILKFEKKDIARAIMEGMVNLLKNKLDTLKEHGITADSAVMVGGPSEDPVWKKLISEICGIDVRVIHGEVAGAVGAAVLAGIGAGIYRDEFHANEIINK